MDNINLNCISPAKARVNKKIKSFLCKNKNKINILEYKKLLNNNCCKRDKIVPKVSKKNSQLVYNIFWELEKKTMCLMDQLAKKYLIGYKKGSLKFNL